MVAFTLSRSALAICRALAVYVSRSFGVFEIVPCVLRGCRISVASRRSCIAAVVKGKQEQKKRKALNDALYFLFFFGAGFLCEERRVE